MLKTLYNITKVMTEKYSVMVSIITCLIPHYYIIIHVLNKRELDFYMYFYLFTILFAIPQVCGC